MLSYTSRKFSKKENTRVRGILKSTIIRSRFVETSTFRQQQQLPFLWLQRNLWSFGPATT